MRRRTFLQAAALAGLSVFAPRALRRAGAAPMLYGGPFFIQIHAGGGWDPTSFCDPKGGAPMDNKSVNKSYAPGAIGTSGVFRYAPLSYSVNNTEVYSNKRFFDTHGQRLLVMNGVDTTTNNHDAGTRTTWCGQTGEGFPSLAALVAGKVNQELALPLPYLSYGGFDATEGVVPLTRAGDVGSLQRIAYPNRMDPSNADPQNQYLSADTQARIAKAQQDRLQAMQGTALPFTKSAMGSLYLARSSDDGVSVLADKLSKVKIVQSQDFPDLAGTGGVGDLTSLMQQMQLATIAFSAGCAVSCNIELGGFDTHSNHDTDQTRQLMVLFRGVDYLVSALQAEGLLDKTIIMIGSDFGRTPYYNDGNGKDHWNITSMMFMGPGIPGGHVVGASDASYKAKTVDPSSLNVYDDPNAGKRIQTNHIHRALRRLAKVDGHPVAAQFPLPGEDMPFFG